MSTVANLPWHVADNALNERLAAVRKLLETCSPADLLHLQGEIAGLTYALALPDQLARDPSKAIGDDANAYT